MTPSVMDEVVSFLVLAPQCQSDLRAQVSSTVSCTDASPYGGGAAVAERFKTKSLEVPKKVSERPECGACGRVLRDGDGRRAYPCALRCGERLCSAVCLVAHSNQQRCGRHINDQHA